MCVVVERDRWKFERPAGTNEQIKAESLLEVGEASRLERRTREAAAVGSGVESGVRMRTRVWRALSFQKLVARTEPHFFLSRFCELEAKKLVPE